MDECGHADLLFQGSKFFWRSRNNIDVTIVSHVALAIIEVIAYEPSIDVEAEHIYLNSVILHSRLNQSDIEAKYSFAKQNNLAHTVEFEADVVKRATSDFILNHLIIKLFSKEEKTFEVSFQCGEGSEDGSSVVLCDKPADLLQYKPKHNKLYSVHEVHEALKALAQEQNSLEEQCAKAIHMQAQAGVQLSHKERWRIPLVLGKLAKNKNLNETDSKIWLAVSSNLKTQEDIDNLTKVTLRIVTPQAGAPSSEDRSNDEQHNLEEQCTKAMKMKAQENLSARLSLSSKERWRIPIVLGKLSKSKVLSKADSKIWTAVSHNLKTQEDIDRMTKVTFHIALPRVIASPEGHGANRTPIRSNCTSHNSTPNRSPRLTPRLTPRLSARANSQRLFNGTVSSQNRAQSIAEDDAALTPPRKLHKRAGSKGVAPRSGHKAPKNPASKSVLDAPSTITDVDNDCMEELGGLAIEKSGKTVSLMEPVVAEPVPATGGTSTELSKPSVAVEDNKVETALRVDVANLTITCDDAESVPSPLPEQLSLVNPNLLGTSASRRYWPSPRSSDSSFAIEFGADKSVLLTGDRAKPTKRRSYFGSLLSSFLGTTKDDTSSKGTSSGCAVGAGAGANALEQPPALTLSNKQVNKKRNSTGRSGEGLSFSAALAAWFPWTHSATVVPADPSSDYVTVRTVKSEN